MQIHRVYASKYAVKFYKFFVFLFNFFYKQNHILFEPLHYADFFQTNILILIIKLLYN